MSQVCRIEKAIYCPLHPPMPERWQKHEQTGKVTTLFNCYGDFLRIQKLS